MAVNREQLAEFLTLAQAQPSMWNIGAITRRFAEACGIAEDCFMPTREITAEEDRVQRDAIRHHQELLMRAMQEQHRRAAANALNTTTSTAIHTMPFRVDNAAIVSVDQQWDHADDSMIIRTRYADGNVSTRRITRLEMQMGTIAGAMDYRAQHNAITQTQPKERPEDRGLRLLKENLTPTQLAQYNLYQSFMVIGGDTGRVYRIRHGCSMNIDECNEKGQMIRGWCFLPKGGLVPGDVMLAQKTALELNETESLKVANGHGHHAHAVLNQAYFGANPVVQHAVADYPNMGNQGQANPYQQGLAQGMAGQVLVAANPTHTHTVTWADPRGVFGTMPTS